MLSGNLATNASAEVNATGWTGTNCTVARVTTPVFSGVGAFSCTATGTAQMSIESTRAATVPGQSVTYAVYARTAATARSYQLGLNWFVDAASGAFVSSSTGTTGTDSTTYTLITGSATAPGTAFGMTIVFFINSPVASEIHYQDDFVMQVNSTLRRVGKVR